jgi:dCMP deaminase
MSFGNLTKWDKRFFDLANEVAAWSKDKSRGVGCVIVGPNKEIRSTGYNGFPRLIDDEVDVRHERPIKYKWTEHAERNAVYNAARMGQTTENCTLYSTLYPCADCARAIIQSGIFRVITTEPDWDTDRFSEDFKITKEMFDEAGIIVTFIS